MCVCVVLLPIALPSGAIWGTITSHPHILQCTPLICIAHLWDSSAALHSTVRSAIRSIEWPAIYWLCAHGHHSLHISCYALHCTVHCPSVWCLLCFSSLLTLMMFYTSFNSTDTHSHTFWCQTLTNAHQLRSNRILLPVRCSVQSIRRPKFIIISVRVYVPVQWPACLVHWLEPCHRALHHTHTAGEGNLPMCGVRHREGYCTEALVWVWLALNTCTHSQGQRTAVHFG